MKYPLIPFLLFFCFFPCIAQERKVSLLFAGDAMQHTPQIRAAQTEAGFDYSDCFSEIKPLIEKADISIVNLEVPLAGKPYTGYPMFSAPDDFAKALQTIGFDVLLTSNNHALDKRKKGLERTIHVLDSLRIKHLGTYIDENQRNLRYPTMLIKNGIRIALLNYTYGTNGLVVESPNIVNYIDTVQIGRDIEEAKRLNPDIIIANMHWGEEYALRPSGSQKRIADFLIGKGVQLVIGAHPHVVQPIERKGQNIIVYSLGNFVSNMEPINTQGGLIVKMDIIKSEQGDITISNLHLELIWTHRPEKNGRRTYKLIPVKNYRDEQGLQSLGEESYYRMMEFIRTAERIVKDYNNSTH